MKSSRGRPKQFGDREKLTVRLEPGLFARFEAWRDRLAKERGRAVPQSEVITEMILAALARQRKRRQS